jgi:hypothetical protein
MWKDKLPQRVWVLVAFIVAAATAAWWRTTPARAPSREAILEAGRRLNGDIMVLSMTHESIPLGQIQELAAGSKGVARAELMSHLEVQFGSESLGLSRTGSAILELVSFDSISSRFKLRGARTLQSLSNGHEPQVAVGTVLAEQFRLSLGDIVTITAPHPIGTTGTRSTRCQVMSIVELGFDYFDSRLVIADISHLATFGMTPSAVSILLSSPEDRIGFATRLQRQWGTAWRVTPLEDLLEPLLRNAE